LIDEKKQKNGAFRQERLHQEEREGGTCFRTKGRNVATQQSDHFGVQKKGMTKRGGEFLVLISRGKNGKKRKNYSPKKRAEDAVLGKSQTILVKPFEKCKKKRADYVK